MAQVKDDAKGFGLRSWKDGAIVCEDWNAWGGWWCRCVQKPRIILVGLGTESFNGEQEAHSRFVG